MDMNKFLSFAGIMSVLLFCSCEKETVEEAVSYPDPSSPENVDIYYEKLYSPDEFCEFVGNSFSDYISAFMGDNASLNFKALVKASFDANRSCIDNRVAEEKGVMSIIASMMWKVRIVNYSYWSAGYDGQPIQLSATMCVPVLSNANVSHTLDGMSLCPPHMAYDDLHCPTRFGTIMMTRTAFNHAVVVPDYEGRGITSSRAFSDLQTLAQARQAIDASLAALTVLKNLGYVKGEDFGLYNIGVSQGGGVSYSIHKLIENDITPEQRDMLNLKETFCANGIVNHDSFIDEQLADVQYESDGQIAEYFYLFSNYFNTLPESERNGYSASDFQSHDLINGYSRIDMNHPLMQTLRTALCKNNIMYNWNPQHPIRFESSKDDVNVQQDHHSKYAYDMLAVRPDMSANPNVKFHSFSTPATTFASDYLGPEYMLTHMIADFVSFAHAIGNLSFTGDYYSKDIIPWLNWL